MSFYKAATGFDVPAIDLTLLSPQPKSDGVQFTRRTYSGNQGVSDEGAYIELVWDVAEDEGELDTILSVFGLDGADKTENVTIFCPEPPIYAYNRFSGIAHQPEPGRDLRRDGYWFRLTILITNLVYAAG